MSSWKKMWHEHMENSRFFKQHQQWFIHPPKSYPSEVELQKYEEKIEAVISSVEEHNNSLFANDLAITANVLEDYKSLCDNQHQKSYGELVERLEYLALLMKLYFQAKGASESVSYLREDIEESKKGG